VTKPAAERRETPAPRPYLYARSRLWLSRGVARANVIDAYAVVAVLRDARRREEDLAAEAAPVPEPLL
jgi:hypothetical protein